MSAVNDLKTCPVEFVSKNFPVPWPLTVAISARVRLLVPKIILPVVKSIPVLILALPVSVAFAALSNSRVGKEKPPIFTFWLAAPFNNNLPVPCISVLLVKSPCTVTVAPDCITKVALLMYNCANELLQTINPNNKKIGCNFLIIMLILFIKIISIILIC